MKSLSACWLAFVLAGIFALVIVSHDDPLPTCPPECPKPCTACGQTGCSPKLPYCSQVTTPITK